MLKRAGGWIAEKAARLKLSFRSEADASLSLFEGLELLSLGVLGKRAMWMALHRVRECSPVLLRVDFPALADRALAQYERLEIYRPQPVIPLGLGTMVLQGLLFAWVYPRLFDTARDAWLSSALQFGVFFGVLAWSLAVVPVAAKNRMSSVGAFLRLETAFTAIHYAIVSPLIALAWRTPQ